jgi:hypothetical protein
MTDHKVKKVQTGVKNSNVMAKNYRLSRFIGVRIIVGSKAQKRPLLLTN